MKGRIRWYKFLLIPLVYVVSIVPAWMVGGDLSSLLLFYERQIERLDQVIITAPTVFQLMPGLPPEGMGEAGFVMVAVVVAAVAWMIGVWGVKADQRNVVALAAWSVLVIPYLMPGIRERYFFSADLLTIVLAFYYPRWWAIPVVVSTVSVLSYSRFLGGSETVAFPILSLVMGGVIIWLGREIFRQWVRAEAK